jgi:hypothetical protein
MQNQGIRHSIYNTHTYTNIQTKCYPGIGRGGAGPSVPEMESAFPELPRRPAAPPHRTAPTPASLRPAARPTGAPHPAREPRSHNPSLAALPRSAQISNTDAPAAATSATPAATPTSPERSTTPVEES